MVFPPPTVLFRRRVCGYSSEAGAVAGVDPSCLAGAIRRTLRIVPVKYLHSLPQNPLFVYNFSCNANFIDNCLEVLLGRVINPEGAGKERSRLVKSIVLAMRELMRQSEPDEHSRDLAAYISLALIKINETVESSVVAWEKKGYWVKADRFRMEWVWTERMGKQMREAILNDDWATIALTVAQLGGKLNNVDVPSRNRLGTPWKGAYQLMQK
jgi:hypothetical protein